MNSLRNLILITLTWSSLAFADSQQVPASLATVNNSQFFSRYVFIADKTTRTLSVWDTSNMSKVAQYPADFGKNEGDKLQRNDHKTPEGIYLLTTQLEGAGLDYNQYGSLAFTLNYPNFFDRRQQKTGNGIWLHAIPETKNLQRGSRGCVVLTNEDIKKVRPYIKLGRTPLIVERKMELVDTKQHENSKQMWLAWVEKWRNAWETKNIDNYIQYYGNDFKALGMNRDQWRTHKENLNKQYDSIKVQVIDPIVLVHEDQVIIQFVQSYRSSAHEDTGVKALYVQKQGNDFRIIGEEWVKDSTALAITQVAAPASVASERN